MDKKKLRLHATKNGISITKAISETKIADAKKPKRALSHKVPCPTCLSIIDGTIGHLKMHYQSTHNRKPTEAEAYRFRSYKAKNFSSSNYQIGFVKNRAEVSGGLPSLGKKR